MIDLEAIRARDARTDKFHLTQSGIINNPLYADRRALLQYVDELLAERALIVARAENAEAALVEANETIAGIPTLCRRYEARLAEEQDRHTDTVTELTETSVRLAEAEALLREIQSKVIIMPELRARIDAHLARKP